jgi:glycosyltransferase involved in cell wall biosynthesis
MPPPKFSVVVPTCRREDHLARLLESLRPGVQLADPSLYEVIVSDDASGNTSEAMVREKFPWVLWLQGPQRGPASNRNNAVRRAQGEWVCFIDDDCEASKEWISELDQATQDPAIDMIEGRTYFPNKPDNPFIHGITNEKGGMFWTCNLTVRRSTFVSIGEFDEDFLEPAGEDMEFAFRFHAHHHRSRFSRGSLVYHPARRVGWGTIWHRVLMVRWSALYAYKTGQGLSLSDSAAKNVARSAKDMIMNHLRRTVQEARRWNDVFWRDRWFTSAVRWITFPFAFPYYLYWVYRFHAELSARESGTRENPGQGDQIHHQKVEKVVHHRRLFRFVPKFVQRALHPLWRQFYFVDYVLPEKAEVHTLVDYLPNEPVRTSKAIENIRVLAPAEKVVIAPPTDPFVSVGKYYPDGTFVRPAIVVCDVPEARIHVGTGFVCTRDWEVIPDMEYRLTNYPEIRNWKPRNLTRRAGVYSTIFSWNASNFGHWMFDFLPRLPVLAKAEPTAKVTLLMPDFLRPALRESMEILLPEHFAIEYHPYATWFQTEKFIWAPVVSGRCNFFLPAESFESIRRPIFAKYGLPDKHKKTRRIFVTRRHATVRRVLNETDVSALLARYGFEDVELSELSFRQQVELFHEADIVIGPHGAGLSSIVFSGDIRLVVFYATRLPLNHYHTLARGLGQEHYFLTSNVGEDDSFSVDVRGLEETLTNQLGLKTQCPRPLPKCNE